MLNAGSAKNEAKASGTLSRTPGQTATGSRFHGLIGASWSNPLRIAPCGLKIRKYSFPDPFRIEAILSFRDVSQAALNEK
jgi:hypothetical protein